jgi:hypothetical protein
VSTRKIPSKYADFHWIYCLSCKDPMFGMEHELPSECDFTWTCGHCGSVNIFHNSSQSLEPSCSDSTSMTPSTGIQGIELGTE